MFFSWDCPEEDFRRPPEIGPYALPRDTQVHTEPTGVGGHAGAIPKVDVIACTSGSFLVISLPIVVGKKTSSQSSCAFAICLEVGSRDLRRRYQLIVAFLDDLDVSILNSQFKQGNFIVIHELG